MGRVAVIGGSEDYTGAPYFSAMASARLGADMVGILNSSLTYFDQKLTAQSRVM
jgi:NAD(P)H-hydrate repair Nnr-like enzyme with NAD(P)H-hydrate dehydratase domain